MGERAKDVWLHRPLENSTGYGSSGLSIRLLRIDTRSESLAGESSTSQRTKTLRPSALADTGRPHEQAGERGRRVCWPGVRNPTAREPLRAPPGWPMRCR